MRRILSFFTPSKQYKYLTLVEIVLHFFEDIYALLGIDFSSLFYNKHVNATKSRTTLSDVIFTSDCMVLANNMSCTHHPPNGVDGSMPV